MQALNKKVLIFYNIFFMLILFSQNIYAKSIEKKQNFINDNFIFFDEMRFKNKPNLEYLGFTDIRVIYAAEMWPKNKFSDEIDEEFMKKFFSRDEFKNGGIICIDIEHWPVDIRNYPLTVVNKNIAKYEKVVEIFKEQNPNTMVGFYGLPPLRDYFTPVKNKNINAWQAANAHLESLANKVDVIFPSIYTFYNKKNEWVKYALYNIREAKKYGKKIYPFIWPKYHDSNFLLKNKYIDEAFWELQLETIYDNADGLVIWTMARNAPIWDSNQAWWKATRKFLSLKKSKINYETINTKQ